MSGFYRDPLADINELRNTLHDRYKSGFSIIKELLQNADDAQATHFPFVELLPITL